MNFFQKMSVAWGLAWQGREAAHAYYDLRAFIREGHLYDQWVTKPLTLGTDDFNRWNNLRLIAKGKFEKFAGDCAAIRRENRQNWLGDYVDGQQAGAEVILERISNAHERILAIGRDRPLSSKEFDSLHVDRLFCLAGES